MLRLMAWIIVILVAGSAVIAQDQPADRPLLSGPQAQQESDDRGPRDFAGREPAQRPADRLEEILAKLNLTDAQRAQVQKIVADHFAVMQEHRQKMQEAQQALQAAEESGDEGAIKTARENLQQLRGQGWEPGGLIKQIEPVLTDEQKQQLHDALPHRFGPGGPMDGGPHGPGAPGRGDPGARMQHGLGRLDLTDEQKSKIHAILDEHTQAIRKEVESVLTPEQLQQFRDMQERRGAGGPGDGMGPGQHRQGPPAEDANDDQLDL